MGVSMSAKVTKDTVTPALARVVATVAPTKIAETAAHGMVHEFLPDVFYSNMYGWQKTVRPGMPLMDTGTHLVSGFVYTVSGAVASIRNIFKFAHVHDKGMTIRAKNAKALRFNVRGVGWFRKKSVTIPRRRFMYWSMQARAFVLRRVNEMIRKGMKK